MLTQQPIQCTSPSVAAAAGQRTSSAPAQPPLRDAVEACDLHKSLDDRIVLDNLNFAIPPGRFAGLLGANGAGKSTLLKIIAGLVPPTSGSLHVLGETHGRDAAALRLRIGLISHGPMLYRELSARENLIFFARLCGRADAAERADHLLESLGLADRADDPIKAFSRGMVQRAAIARALLNDPELLLADEPFSGLDAPSRHTLDQILLGLHEQGKTIILAHHDLPHTLSLVEHVMVLRRGGLAVDEPARGLSSAALLEEITAP